MKTRSVLLKFDDPKLREALSVVVQAGKHLWTASDETTSIERLTRIDSDTFGNHESFPLSEYLKLWADPKKEEIDIEGLAYQTTDSDHRYLWIIGSHSLKRKKPEAKHDDVKNGQRLATVESDGNRYLLARVPLETDPETGDDRPAKGVAAQLIGTSRGSALSEALRDDPHIGPFMSIPGKDNGFDIEGLAVAGESIHIGLRGPVLRGWAVVVEIKVEPVPDSRFLTLKEFDGKQPYRKHFLNLEGLGVRELCVRGDDMLILAGPTVNLDGPVKVFRWKNALKSEAEDFVFSPEFVCEVPFGQGVDHAEGVTLFAPERGTEGLLVVYDAPSGARKSGETDVKADVFEPFDKTDDD